ncbi:hypothetical protein ACIBFB_13640 [Nocardiopsis sp. NPDC050513]|uniref:hypothetical protein n=1 Tax=Nocardiopsis sp. NPDC050513 TaxID=3364338 RepID=UPI0037A485A7
MNRTPPRSVRWATALWAVAVASGVAETALAVAPDLPGAGPGLWVNLALRVAVYTFAALLVVWFARGLRWARAALTVLLTVVGLGTLTVPAVLAVAEGATVLDALGLREHGPLFTGVRAAHVVAVLAASALMFAPSANRFFARPSPDGPRPATDAPTSGDRTG